MNFLHLLCLLFVLTSCAEKGGSGGGHSKPNSDNPRSEEHTDSDTNTDFPHIKVEAKLIDMNSQEREEKLKKAIKLLEEVLNSNDFKERVSIFTYNGLNEFKLNNSLSNDEILSGIHDGAEDLKPEIDNTANLELTFYYTSSSTVGYTTTSVMLINLNTRFFDQYDLAHVAGNLAHEWMHKLGYRHASRNNSTRIYTVPYGVGYLVRDIGEELQ